MRLHISEEEKRIEVKRTILPFVLWLCLLSIILSPSRSKLQQETSNQRTFFFSKKAKQLYIVCCFPFTWNDCANEDPFPIKGTALVNVENDFAQQGQCKR